jgi:hypothetical protein
MARLDLIDTYLATLAERIRWRSDLEDVMAEAEDHLYTTVERLTALGSSVEAAQMTALHRFGRPDLIATAYARTSHGGLAMPTRFTHSGGTLALASAVLWSVTLAAWWLAGAAGMAPSDPELTAAYLIYGVGAATLLGAGVTLVVSMLAIDQRHGGLGALGKIGLAVIGVSVVLSLAAWVFLGWGIALAAGTAIFAAAMRGYGVMPRAATVAFGAGPTVGVIIWIIVRATQGLPLTYTGLWGDDWVANLLALTIGLAFMAAGLLGLGRWLRSERAVFDDGSDGALTA